MIDDLSPEIRAKIKKMPGIRVKVNDRCTGCGSCQDVCFLNSITIEDEKAIISEECRGCGRCVNSCPDDAIEIAIEDQDYLERSIEEISSVVDLS